MNKQNILSWWHPQISLMLSPCQNRTPLHAAETTWGEGERDTPKQIIYDAVCVCVCLGTSCQCELLQLWGSFCFWKKKKGGGGEIGRKIEKGERGDRGRGWCVFSWSTSSLMLALICLGWKRSTRLEYWWRLGYSAPSLLLLLFLPLSLILTPSIYPLYTYSTFCLLNWFPASCLSLSPSPFFFTPPHLGSLPMQLHSADPNFSSHPSSPSIHLSIWPRSTSPAARSITYRLHYPAPFLLPHVFFRLALLPIPPLISPSALPRTALVFSALALRVLSFSVGLPSSSFGLPPVTFYVSLSSSPSLSGPCELIPGLCGSRGWWDVKSEVCILCVFLWQSEGRVAEGKQEVGLERDNYKKSTGQLRFGVQPGLDEMCSVFSQLGC